MSRCLALSRPKEGASGKTGSWRVALQFQTVVNEGFEKLQGHFLGQAALMQAQVRSDHDHRPAGIIHPLSQQVLSESTLFALQHIGEGFERPAIRP